MVGVIIVSLKKGEGMELLAVLLSFWVFYPVLAMVVIMLTWVAYDGPGHYPVITLLAFVLILQFLGKIPIWEFIVVHPLWILGYITAYFALGVPYSLFELNRFCRRTAEEYNTAKQRFFASWREDRGGVKEDAWIEECKYHFREFREGTFSIRSYKGKILAWMTYWPWYLVWRLVHDLVKEIWEYIYSLFQGIYQRIADHYFADILRDFSPTDRSKKK